MKITKEEVFLIEPPSYDLLLCKIESAGRTCYKSNKETYTRDAAERFVRQIISRGHESVIEHGSITARFICDRGISHEIVRHRLASYSQESTRYCNYASAKFNNEITVIEPCYFRKDTLPYQTWYNSCFAAENAYFTLLNQGCTPEQARAVLPMSLKTEIVMTANLREWRHFLKLRTAENAHPQMRLLALILLGIFQCDYPVFFEDFTA